MSREFDVIVFGATGFTGRLVAEYLITHAAEMADSAPIRWAMAGRSQEKLEHVRDLIGAPADTALITADSADGQSLRKLAARTKVILTTVGPYQLYGTDLVAACVENGTDYVDLCGEPPWMHDIIKTYDAPAQKSGARIVLSCGFDSIPFDMGVYFLQQHALEKTGKTCSDVRGRVRKMKGKFSGGTAASFAQSMKRAAKEPHVLGLLKDPFSLVPDYDGVPQPAGHKPKFEADIDSWAAPFIMASINTKNIHRSNALQHHVYGKDFTYSEMMLTGPGEKGEHAANFVASDNSMATNPPKPGEGPTQEERDTGFYDVMFIGSSDGKTSVVAAVGGTEDPGYGSTSKMISQAALCLAFDIDHAETGGGVYTTAPAMGMNLIHRLQQYAGLYFKIES